MAWKYKIILTFKCVSMFKKFNYNNYIISKLLNLNASVDSNNCNVLLENYGLQCNLKHRLFIRMATFKYNVIIVNN